MKDFGFFLFLRALLWPAVILAIGLYIAYAFQVFLLDHNKVVAATNRAYCQIEMMKNNQNDFTICKDIFDSARR